MRGYRSATQSTTAPHAVQTLEAGDVWENDSQAEQIVKNGEKGANMQVIQEFQRQGCPRSMDAETEIFDNNLEEQGIVFGDDPVDKNDPLKRQSWLELEMFTVWPAEKTIPKIRNNRARNVSVHFADEKHGQLAEFRCVEECKKRSCPAAWFWWAVEEEEARQLSSAGSAVHFDDRWNCWIVHESDKVDFNISNLPKVPSEYASPQHPTLAQVFGHQVLWPQSSNPPHESEKDTHEKQVARVEKVPDSNWCDVVIKRLKDDSRVLRDIGLKFLLSIDCDMRDSEYPHVGPKNGDVIMPLALSLHGYQVIQEALMVAPCGQHGMIISRLHGNVQELVASPHGCEVLETVVEYAEPSKAVFVAKELEASACVLARTPEKYQLIMRLLEHLPASTYIETESIVEELLGEVPALCRHPRGNHVIQHLLEYGSPAQQEKICTLVAGDLLNLAKHRIASHVVEKAVDASDFTASSLVAQSALIQEGALLALACNRQSQFVAQRLAKRPGAQGDAIRCALHANMQQLKASKYGSRIVESLASTLLGAKAGA